MPRARQPNTGPYIVSHRPRFRPEVWTWTHIECHTWTFACETMRRLVKDNKEVMVKFA